MAVEQLRLRPSDEPWLIPVRFDECDVPDIDLGAGRTLTDIQCVDLFGRHYDGQAEQLVIRLSERVFRETARDRTTSATSRTTATPVPRRAGSQNRVHRTSGNRIKIAAAIAAGAVLMATLAIVAILGLPHPGAPAATPKNTIHGITISPGPTATYRQRAKTKARKSLPEHLAGNLGRDVSPSSSAQRDSQSPAPRHHGHPHRSQSPELSSPAPSSYDETVGGAANTWTDYNDAGGTEGSIISASTTVEVTCRVSGFRVNDGDTWWYRVASSPWSNAFYASADAFYNDGRTSGSLIGTPFSTLRSRNAE